MEESPLDISTLSHKAIERLSNAELEPVLRQGHWDLFGRMMSDRDLAENLEAVRAGHWAPGLPTALGGGSTASVGL